MIQKKVCMLGTSAVGKTSLVSQFVSGIFSEKYLTTMGVKIDRKEVSVDGRPLLLMLWDLEGDDRFRRLSMSYLRGAAGYLLVADGTRRETLDAAVKLHFRAQAELGEVPFVLLLNKADLQQGWELDEQDVADLEGRGWDIIASSAKTGMGVDEAFHRLARLTVTPA